MPNYQYTNITAPSPTPIQNLEGEEWRVCVESENYAVSNHGRVKRIKFHRYTRQYEYLLTPVITTNGYAVVTLKAPKHLAVHRLVCRAFHGEPLPHQTDVNHKDNDRTNNRADNLEWMTRKENLHWGKQQGRDNTGARNGMATLTEDCVKEIIHLLKTTSISITKIGKMMNVSVACISNVNRGKQWKYLTVNEILPLRPDRSAARFMRQ